MSLGMPSSEINVSIVRRGGAVESKWQPAILERASHIMTAIGLQQESEQNQTCRIHYSLLTNLEMYISEIMPDRL